MKKLLLLVLDYIRPKCPLACWMRGHKYFLFPGQKYRRTKDGYGVVRPAGCDVCHEMVWVTLDFYCGEPPEGMEELPEWYVNRNN